VDVTEDWLDSNGHGHADFRDVVPPVVVPGDPQPFYVMPIVQEEGVPIGG